MVLEIIVAILTILLILAGLVGVFIPGLPGTFLILLGVFIYTLLGGITGVEIGMLITLTVLVLISFALGYISTNWGARKFGASKLASAMAVVGAVGGFFILGLIGMVVFGILLAIICDLIIKKDLKSSLKTGLGVFLGLILAQIGNIIIAFLMIGIFIKYLV